jgi:hypothetical protein
MVVIDGYIQKHNLKFLRSKTCKATVLSQKLGLLEVHCVLKEPTIAEDFEDFKKEYISLTKMFKPINFIAREPKQDENKIELQVGEFLIKQVN